MFHVVETSVYELINRKYCIGADGLGAEWLKPGRNDCSHLIIMGGER